MDISRDIWEFLRVRKMLWLALLMGALVMIAGVYVVASQPDMVIMDSYPL